MAEQPLNEFEQPLENELGQPPSTFFSGEQSHAPQIDISHLENGSIIVEEESVPVRQSEINFEKERSELTSKQSVAATRNRRTPSIRTPISSGSMAILNSYIKRNLPAMESIVQHEFGGDVGSGYTLHRSNLYEVVVHLLSIDPVEVLDADGQNILYSTQYGEPAIVKWFGHFCRSSHNQQGTSENDQVVSLSELLQFLRYIVEEYHLVVRERIREAASRRNRQYGNDSMNPEELSQLDIKQELLRTKHRYERLLQAPAISDGQKRSLVALLNSVKQQLTELTAPRSQPARSRPHKDFRPEVEVRGCLETIFEYYCKQSYTAGRNPTFDRILHENGVLSMSKFMLFCRDFGLVRNTEFLRGRPESELELKPAEIVEIFKHNSLNYKEMNYQQFQTALKQIAGSIFKDSDALARLYQHLGIGDEASFRNKLRMLHIPFSYKQVKRTNTPASNYKFRFFAHGGKLAEAIKETIEHRARSKDNDEIRGGTAVQENNSVRPLAKFRSMTENVEVPRLPASRETERLKQSAAPVPRRRISRMPTENPSHVDSSKKHAQEIYLNANYIRLIGDDINAMPTNNHSSYQTTNVNVTGYSNIYKQKQTQKKSAGRWNYKLNNVVTEARNLVAEKDPLDHKGYLQSLIEDEDEDDYLQRHYQMEQQHSDGAFKSKVNRRINEYYQAEIDKEKFLEGISQNNSRTIASGPRPSKKLTYI